MPAKFEIDQPTRPLVPTTIRTEFGEVLESEIFNSQQVGRDITYTPGYSDMRRERDQQIAEVAQGRRSPANVRTLPVRCQLVRTTRVSGEPDTSKPTMYGSDGYRAATDKDVGSDWLKALPPGAQVAAGGEIRVGDCTLMVCDAKQAARNAAYVRHQTNIMTQNAAPKLMQLGATKQGSDPTFESTPGPSVPVPRSAIKG